jgi:hypothetical protein
MQEEQMSFSHDEWIIKNERRLDLITISTRRRLKASEVSELQELEVWSNGEMHKLATHFGGGLDAGAVEFARNSARLPSAMLSYRFAETIQDPSDEMIEELIRRGYRRTSNSYGMVARIDRQDWIEVLVAETLRNQDVVSIRDNPGSFADFYRRCVSRDVKTVSPSSLVRKFPSSNHDPIGYIPLYGTLESVGQEKAP